MPAIKLLPENLISKIAAGEVVDRPASVVKELLENSLDAGACFVAVEIEKAGLKKIAVMDDGTGMEREDLAVCFLPHTTSKIASEIDLESILSFGFRGEALSSISAVSLMTIKSRPKNNNLGTQLTLKNRKIEEINACGMSNGTEIIVENLFYNTPARKKFLKTLGTEFGLIVSLVTKVALSHPQVGFSLKHNGKIILEFPPNQTVLERIKIVLGPKIVDNLIPISGQGQNTKISGLIGKPQIASSVKNKQFIFVNNRLIKNVSLSLAIKDAYGGLLEPRVHPVFLLSLTLPPENIDVNIHPRKEEIKFLDLPNILKNLTATIKETLSKNNLTYKFDLGEVPLYDSYDLSDKGLVLRDSPRDDNYTASFLKDITDLWQVKENNEAEPILQINNLYLIAKTPKGILIIDQHAAHERILYEQLLESFNENKSQVYTLPRSTVFDLPAGEVPFLEEKLPIFKTLGFDIEPFGKNSFKVNAIPQVFRSRDIANLIVEVLSDLKQDKDIKNPDLKTEKIISYLACRSAIKAGDYLKSEERQKLLEKLVRTKSNYTCPHGRPVQIEVSMRDLDSLFRRR